MKTYTAKEINQYMGYNKTQQNDNKQQFMTRCKNAGLILQDIPTPRGCPNQYIILKDDFFIQDEIWKVCYCYPEWEVSSLGRVRRIATKKLLGQAGEDGYVSITGKGENNKTKRFMAHRLIYFTFYPELIEQQDHLVIDHIDGCRSNNAITNLRAISSRRNTNLREENNKPIQELVGQLIIKYGYEETYKKLTQLL